MKFEKKIHFFPHEHDFYVEKKLENSKKKNSLKKCKNARKISLNPIFTLENNNFVVDENSLCCFLKTLRNVNDSVNV